MSTLTEKKISSKKSVTAVTEETTPVKVFLIGMMGAGKTYWAEKLKKKLKVSAYDLDSLVEMMEEKTVSEIFEEDGEEYFRKAESKMLRLFAEKKMYIVSCGGGTACYNDNMKWMNKQGITIWIDEPVEVLCERLLRESSHRPLIKKMDKESLETFLNKKIEERAEFYNQASYRLTGEAITESNLVKIIKEHA